MNNNVLMIIIVVLILYSSNKLYFTNRKDRNFPSKIILSADKMIDMASKLPAPSTVYNTTDYTAPSSMPLGSQPSAGIMAEYDILASSAPLTTGIGINRSISQKEINGQPNLYFNWPANYDGGRLTRNARDFPAYGQPMPDKYNFGRMFYAEYPEISYRPGFW